MAESRVAIETLARLGEDAFEGDSDESLMANLRDMRDGDWTALPTGAERTIADSPRTRWLGEMDVRGLCLRTRDDARR
jgi:hypothetical protein